MHEEKALQTLLILDSLRGTDSTGIAVIGKDGLTKMAKAIGNPYELINTKTYDKALLGANRAIIGHNRYATQGKLTKDNAHPFNFTTLVGAHNGTLTSKYKLKDAKYFDVDSENLFYHIDQDGLYGALEHLEGAWSLVWWDKVKETLHFLRNKERPMFITSNLAGTCLFWASEKWMLEVALSRHAIVRGDITETPIDTLMSFNINNAGFIEKPHAVEMKSRAIPFTRNPSYTVVRNGQVVGVPVGQQTSNNRALTLVKPPFKRKEAIISDDPYVFSKGVHMEVLKESTDSYGARFYSLVDPHNKANWIRLFIKNTDKPMKPGTQIIADISVKLTDRTSGLKYYKVAHNSVEICKDDEKKLYKDDKGNLLSFNEFCDKHGECGFCTGWVDPDKEHRFTLEGNALCHVCIDDESISSYIRYKH